MIRPRKAPWAVAICALAVTSCGEVEDYVGPPAVDEQVQESESDETTSGVGSSTDSGDGSGDPTTTSLDDNDQDGAPTTAQDGSEDSTTTDSESESEERTPTLEYDLVATYPHDAGAFTQGLAYADGVIIEGTGMYGESTRRRVGLTNGEVSSAVRIDDDLFGAGLALIGDGTLIQLTWREGVAILADTVTLQEFDRFNYSGEGWGLCSDGERLIMSDGTSELTLRDPMSFAEAGVLEVTRDGEPLDSLNELECVGSDIWANVWLTNEIVRIDGQTGEVTGAVDLTALVPAGPLGSEDVLNGIAFNDETGTFYVTGKSWDVLYELAISAP